MSLSLNGFTRVDHSSSSPLLGSMTPKVQKRESVTRVSEKSVVMSSGVRCLEVQTLRVGHTIFIDRLCLLFS